MGKRIGKHFKKAGAWLRRNGHPEWWTVALAALVVAIPIAYGWTYLRAPFSSVPLFQTAARCDYPIDASCVCAYMDERGYLDFRDEKCKALSAGQSVSLSPEELSRVSKYFVAFPNSRLGELVIVKTAEDPDACTEKGYCDYVINIGDSLTARS
ncbi:MAG: hypothetical protein NT016_03785 [Candidatus Aenigmarchaeota archaeon]|nr:hypothetical protein [Candidatus Aenigmarchaeota archaeon]